MKASIANHQTCLTYTRDISSGKWSRHCWATPGDIGCWQHETLAPEIILECYPHPTAKVTASCFRPFPDTADAIPASPSRRVTNNDKWMALTLTGTIPRGSATDHTSPIQWHYTPQQRSSYPLLALRPWYDWPGSAISSAESPWVESPAVMETNINRAQWQVLAKVSWPFILKEAE